MVGMLAIESLGIVVNRTGWNPDGQQLLTNLWNSGQAPWKVW